MIEVLEFLFVAFIVALSFFFTYSSVKLVEEKKQRQRAGLTDYYDNPIKKEL